MPVDSKWRLVSSSMICSTRPHAVGSSRISRLIHSLWSYSKRIDEYRPQNIVSVSSGLTQRVRWFRFFATMFMASNVLPVCDLPIRVTSCPGLAPPSVASSKARTPKLHSLPARKSCFMRRTCSPLGVNSLRRSWALTPSISSGSAAGGVGADAVAAPVTSCLASSMLISLGTYSNKPTLWVNWFGTFRP